MSSTAQPTRLAAIQMVSSYDLDANLKSASRLIAEAAQQGAQLLVLPETFAVFSEKAAREHAERESDAGGPIQDFLAERARQFGITLVGGSIPVRADDGRAWARSVVYGPDGTLLGRYNKIHLFDAAVSDGHGQYQESKHYAPGDETVVLDSPVGKIGMSICYDLRFAELFLQLRQKGAEIIVVPSAFTRNTGQAHWLPLLRARAIETQCVLVGANQGGQHSERRSTSGGSAVIDAWGRVCAECGFGEGIALAEWDVSAQQKIRDDMPVMNHRRLGL